MTMNERIKERRVALGYTQEELGTMLGLQKSAIAKYEKGRVENIKRTTIKEMARILQCSPSYLMGWDDNLTSSGDLIAKIVMDTELLGYVEKLYLLSPDKRAKVYGYIDAV